MGIIGGRLGYALLKLLAPRHNISSPPSDEGVAETKLEQHFGNDFFDLIRGTTIIDFGCGSGHETVEMAQKGALRVIGIDIQEHFLANGRQMAEQQGVADRCSFVTSTSELADIIVSKDAFEHFSDPSAILDLMSSQIKPNGCVLASFGPTWLHPYGGHLFSIFPWSHLIFSEQAQIRWRSDFKFDGATKFSEVAGGLNQLTISTFEKTVERSPFRIVWLETVPIKGISIFRTKCLREMGSSIVRCKLMLKDERP